MATNQYMVYNPDVAGLQRRINRFIIEMSKAASNQFSMMNDFDQTRLQTYLNAIRAYVAWVTSQPQLDLPETSPKTYVLDADPTYELVENESIIDILRMLEIARTEIVNGQSARMPSGFISFDVTRVLSVVDKIENFLNDYVKVITPLDLPESSPSRASSGPGNTGV